MSEAAANEPVQLHLPLLYKIIRGMDVRDLAEACNKAVHEGWQPLGGPMYSAPTPMDIANIAGGIQPHPYWQAFIRRED